MSGSSKRPVSKWQRFRQKDAFVRNASRLGVRSRSFFKLEELDQQFKLLKSGMKVLDLGASPGGWSQYAQSRVGKNGMVLATDILSMQPISGVQFIQCDLASNDAPMKLFDHLKQRKVDLVLSDMAPNITGNATIDSRNYFDLYAAIFKVCEVVLIESGSLAFKFFQTAETSILKQNCKILFDSCKIYKPQSSRSTSQESYMVSRNYHPQNLAESPLALRFSQADVVDR